MSCAALAVSIPALIGCGAAAKTGVQVGAGLSITPGISNLDTNCSGCNGTNSRGEAVQRFSAVLADGAPAAVIWSVSGGDGAAGAGRIDGAGEYRPPEYLTADHAEVVLTARLKSNPRVAATARVMVTPGFLQPLTPENAALGGGDSLTITGKLAVAGSGSGIRFSLDGAGSDAGTLGPVSCERAEKSFTTCSVTYTAPAGVSGDSLIHVTARATGPGGTVSQTRMAILLNPAGVTSNPVEHQELLPTAMPLGGSGGNNADFDAHGDTIADCCSGTLGALVEDDAGRQYILSNNHVLARSDHATPGDTIVQPGLIDNNCTPNGVGPGTVPIASLFAWAPLRSSTTNVDAAIAQVASHTVDATGKILELGARQSDGQLAAAPPGVSSSGGRGESASLGMQVAKSGRTTGLTCGRVSAVDVDVSVDYFSDCAETRPYLTKVFKGQIALSGDRFSDAGDSGSLVVDAGNAEPVGLFFAGGVDAQGVSQGVANPATEVLTQMGAAAGENTTFRYVGGDDHPVSCIQYGSSEVRGAQRLALSDAEIQRGQQALYAARELVNPAKGILGVAMGKSSDEPGTSALLVYVGEGARDSVPPVLGGVRTVVIPATAEQVAMGSAALDNGGISGRVSAGSLNRAVRVKKQVAAKLMREESAFFAVGVGESLDNPREAALVIYVDRNRVPSTLPMSLEGVRTRYVLMNRLHVTRSYANGAASSLHCMPKKRSAGAFFQAKPAALP